MGLTLDTTFVRKELARQKLLIEKALVYRLSYFIDQLVNHAKNTGSYTDRTSNLRSSIGGVLLKDGVPVTYKGFDGKVEGINTGKQFLAEVIGKVPSGYVIVIVAGMEYATYVEDGYDFVVLRESELKMFSELPGIIEKIKLAAR